MEVIGIANSKGGSGKTTTAINLASALSRVGKKVLLWDFDPQASLSNAYKVEYPQDQIYSEDIIGSNKVDPFAAPVQINENLYLIPSTSALGGFESVLAQTQNDLLRLKVAVHKLRSSFDFIIIDPPGATDIFMAATLAAIDYVIIPVRPTDTDFQTLATFIQTIEKAKSINPNLEIKKLLFNQVNMTSKSKDLFKSLLNDHPLQDRVSNSMIRIANSVGLSTGQGKDIFEFDPKSKVVQDYKALAQEVLSWH